MSRWKRIFLAETLLFLILIGIDKSLIMAFVSILIHELAHIYAAKRKGCKLNGLQVHIYGSKAEVVNIEELSRKEKIQVYAAGPLANFIIICVFIIVRIEISSQIIDNIISINLGLFIFNLIPAYPLDGARILEAALSKKILYKRVNNIICKISYGIAALLVVIFIIVFIKGDIVNITILLAAVLVIYITQTEKKSAMYILMGNIFVKRKKLIRNKYIENRSISVYYKHGLANIMTIIDKDKFNIFYILDDDLKVLFIMNEDELIEALKIYGNITLEEYNGKRVGKSI